MRGRSGGISSPAAAAPSGDAGATAMFRSHAVRFSFVAALSPFLSPSSGALSSAAGFVASSGDAGDS
ncbi:hypothetical protein GCM10029978_061760 [Actinoallomurus acanthiterrae]